MLQHSCLNFIEDLASKKPVPGGGGASALVASIGMALGMMVGNLTVGKQKYAAVEEEMKSLLKASQELVQRLEELVQKDASAFAPLAAAYGLPASTQEEKEIKNQRLQEALISAIEAPMELLEETCKALCLLKEYAHKGSALVLSDAGVGVACCRAAIFGAKLNVQINLNLLKNMEKKAFYEKKMNKLVEDGTVLADEIYTFVETCLQEGI